MNISVISPKGSNTGSTTLAILLALDLANRGRKVCLTNANNVAESFYEYFNLSSFEDKTSTPSQVVKLIKEGAIQPSDVSDYCKKINDNLELFCNSSKAFTENDMEFMIDYIGSKMPHDYIIYDLDIGMLNFPKEEMTKRILKLSDVVILNISQSVRQLQDINRIKDAMIKEIDKKPTIVVINKFSEVQSTIKETATWMGVKKPNNWLIFRNNPWIGWGTNHGKITQVYTKMKSSDARVIDIASDLNKLSSNILRIKSGGNKERAGVNYD